MMLKGLAISQPVGESFPSTARVSALLPIPIMLRGGHAVWARRDRDDHRDRLQKPGLWCTIGICAHIPADTGVVSGCRIRAALDDVTVGGAEVPKDRELVNRLQAGDYDAYEELKQMNKTDRRYRI